MPEPIFSWNPSPTSRAALDELVARVSFLPAAYADRMRANDGGEGFIGPHFVVIDSLDFALELNEDHEERLKGLGWFIFGGNGAGEVFVFERGLDGSISVWMAPLSDFSNGAGLLVACDFDAFLAGRVRPTEF